MRQLRLGPPLVAALLLMAQAGSAAGQTPVEAFGDWRIRCVAQGGPCALAQYVVDGERPAVDLEVLAWRWTEGGPMLQVRVPLGAWLRAGIELRVNGETIGRMSFERCSVDGCFAEVLLDERLLGLLRGGESALFVIRLYDEQDRGIGFPITLTGFAAGFDALPAGG